MPGRGSRPPRRYTVPMPLPREPRLDALDRLRAHRVRADKDVSMRSLLEREAVELRRTQKRLGNAAAVWAETCPPDLLGHTSLAGLLRGVLTIRVRDASTRYELDRMLRSGGEAAMVRRLNAPVRKVKLVVAPPGSAPGSAPDSPPRNPPR
ncbi:MAG: DUF721 domain-containing protein [Phycisphaerales bacterium]|nr:MAG: DUF721 domain-containing protein [Phycisphaerales bacterium]